LNQSCNLFLKRFVFGEEFDFVEIVGSYVVDELEEACELLKVEFLDDIAEDLNDVCGESGELVEL